LNHNSKYEEKALLDLSAKGDGEAFATLFRSYAPLLETNIRRMIWDKYDASEVLQETFIKLWVHRKKLKDVIAARAYFNRVALNECLDYLSKLAKQNKLRLSAHFSSTIVSGPEEAFAYKETEKIIQDAIDNLPQQRKKIYYLSRNGGLNSYEIAKELNLNPDYVRQAISASRKYIKDCLFRNGKSLISLLFILTCCAINEC